LAPSAPAAPEDKASPRRYSHFDSSFGLPLDQIVKPQSLLSQLNTEQDDIVKPTETRRTKAAGSIGSKPRAPSSSSSSLPNSAESFAASQALFSAPSPFPTLAALSRAQLPENMKALAPPVHRPAAALSGHPAMPFISTAAQSSPAVSVAIPKAGTPPPPGLGVASHHQMYGAPPGLVPPGLVAMPAGLVPFARAVTPPPPGLAVPGGLPPGLALYANGRGTVSPMPMHQPVPVQDPDEAAFMDRFK
jgi:hypothetical protein